MPKISSLPPVGAIAFGKSGIGHPIIRLESSSVVLRTSNGLLRVPLTSIQHWELPKLKPLRVGDMVRLRGTSSLYLVVRVHEVFRGREDNEAIYESWTDLVTSDGKPAYWPMKQLEGG